MEKYKPIWSALSRHPMPQWLWGAMFGIYTHWGPYSVPAYAGIDHWRANDSQKGNAI
jgi:alpha-L-fucosidase